MSQTNIPPDKKIAINNAMEKVLRLAGLPENSLGFSFADQIDQTYSETSGDMDIYVDPVNGDDNNTGTSSAPFKSIQAAINRVPKVVRHGVVIRLAAGDYYVTPNFNSSLAPTGGTMMHGFTVDNSLCGLDGKSYAYFRIEGAMVEALSSTTATGGSAPSSTAYATGTVVVSTANWTIDQFKGMFVEFLSGATGMSTPPTSRALPGYGLFAYNNLGVIIGNTATTITFVHSSLGGVNGATFRVLNPASIIHNSLASSPTVGLNTAAFEISGCRGNLPFRYFDLALCFVKAQSHGTLGGAISIVGSDNPSLVGVVADSSTGGSAFSGALSINHTRNVTITRCAILGGTTDCVRAFNSYIAPTRTWFSVGSGSKTAILASFNCYISGSNLRVDSSANAAAFWCSDGSECQTSNVHFNMTGGTSADAIVAKFNSYVDFSYGVYSGSCSGGLVRVSRGSRLFLGSGTYPTGTVGEISLDDGSTWSTISSLSTAGGGSNANKGTSAFF